jgi:hypothetical protein
VLVQPEVTAQSTNRLSLTSQSSNGVQSPAVSSVDRKKLNAMSRTKLQDIRATIMIRWRCGPMSGPMSGPFGLAWSDKILEYQSFPNSPVIWKDLQKVKAYEQGTGNSWISHGLPRSWLRCAARASRLASNRRHGSHAAASTTTSTLERSIRDAARCMHSCVLGVLQCQLWCGRAG